MTDAEWNKIYEMSKDKDLFANLMNSLFPTIHGHEQVKKGIFLLVSFYLKRFYFSIIENKLSFILIIKITHEVLRGKRFVILLLNMEFNVITNQGSIKKKIFTVCFLKFLTFLKMKLHYIKKFF